MPKYAPGAIESANANRRSTNQNIASGLVSLVEGITKGYVNKLERDRDEEIIQKIQENPDMTPMEQMALITKLSPTRQSAVLQAYKVMKNQELAREREYAQNQRFLEEQQYKENREERLRTQNAGKDLTRSYQSRLSAIKDQMKDLHMERDKKPLRDEQKALQKELGQNLARLKRGERPVFQYLDIEQEKVPSQVQKFDTMNQLSGGMPQGQQQQEPQALTGANQMQQGRQAPQGNAPQPQARAQKQRWDKNNPQHAAFAAKVFAETGNDRSATNKILAEQFER